MPPLQKDQLSVPLTCVEIQPDFTQMQQKLAETALPYFYFFFGVLSLIYATSQSPQVLSFWIAVCSPGWLANYILAKTGLLLVPDNKS